MINQIMRLFRCPTVLMGALLVLSTASLAVGDEVDDILALKARNRDRIRSITAEYTVVTTPVKGMKTTRSSRMKYRMKMERISPSGSGNNLSPWSMELDMLEPLPMNLKVDGERIWHQDRGGEWVEMKLSQEKRDQIMNMSERHLGGDPAEQRKHFDIKVVRRNNPIFGSRTVTLGYVSKGKKALFRRMEEDVNPAGLSVATRIYGRSEAEYVEAKVKRFIVRNGVPFAEETETRIRTPNDEVFQMTTVENLALELQ